MALSLNGGYRHSGRLTHSKETTISQNPKNQQKYDSKFWVQFNWVPLNSTVFKTQNFLGAQYTFSLRCARLPKLNQFFLDEWWFRALWDDGYVKKISHSCKGTELISCLVQSTWEGRTINWLADKVGIWDLARAAFIRFETQWTLHIIWHICKILTFCCFMHALNPIRQI